MRTTVTLDDDVISYLRDETGIKETGTLIREALLQMRQRLAAERIIALGGSEPGARAAPRRRPPHFMNED